ncbi:MAG: 3-isopropylmalate dehydratase small subunit [Desulfobulbaceae bacterium]|nr:MAG: 3-isopropylmalate dehydratase small subunit [Desulfobulbaceae bacterium]
MKQFGGPAVFLDRNDINTDEIIPAKYLTEITKTALKPHLLEDLLLDGKPFDHQSPAMQRARVVITRANFGCGSSREHAVWAFEVNDINIIIAESFARIFRQNMFNCGILAIELGRADLDRLFALPGNVEVAVDLQQSTMTAISDAPAHPAVSCTFTLNSLDRDLVAAGGWLNFADQRY